MCAGAGREVKLGGRHGPDHNGSSLPCSLLFIQTAVEAKGSKLGLTVLGLHFRSLTLMADLQVGWRGQCWR